MRVGNSASLVRSIACILLCCLLVQPAWSQTGTGTSAGKTEDLLIQEALRAYQSGQLEIAVGKLRQASGIAPTNPFARLYLGLMLYQQDARSLEAQRLMESVQEKFSANSDLNLRLLDSYLALGSETKVPGLLEQIQKPMRDNTRFAFNVIYTLVRYGQLEPARRELSKISGRLEGKPNGARERDQKPPADQAPAQDLAEVHFIRGLIAASSDQKDDALQLFQAADRSGFPPRNSPQMRMLAEALFRLEEFSVSAQAYQVYLTHFPQDNDARLQLGIACCSYSAFSRAQEQFQQLFEKAPGMPEVNYYLGLVLLELKKIQEARRHFELELKSNPASCQAMAQMAYLDYMQGENEQCRMWLDKAAALDPDWVETNFVYGLLYNRLGKFDLAIKHLDAATKEAPRHIKAHYQLSIAYMRNGNEAKAKEHMEIYERLLEAHKTRSLGGDPRKK